MTTGQKVIDVKEQFPGSRIEHFFILRGIQYQKKRDGGAFVRLELGNLFGRVPAVLWEPPEDFGEDFQEGNIVKIRGSITEYKNVKQITVEIMRNAVPEDGVEMEEFLPGYPGDLDALKNRLKEIIENIQNPFLNKLLSNIFGDEDIFKQYCRSPAGKLWHHTYLGGLLHHSLSLVDICTAAAEVHPSVDKEILIAGALLHDVGKIDELSVSGFFDYTDDGRLIGHIVQGTILVDKFVKEIPDFPKELYRRLIHMILSHQGTPANNSPRVPMTIEGLVLHYADELDSQVNAFERIAEQEARPGKVWSDYVKLKERYFYFGGSEEE